MLSFDRLFHLSVWLRCRRTTCARRAAVGGLLHERRADVGRRRHDSCACRSRERYDELAAAPGDIRRRDLAAMEPRDFAAETQSQAAAGFIALLAAKESLEDEWQIRRSDPRSAVGDFHYRPPVAVLQGYRDLSVFGRELEGVVEQINQQTPDVALVPVDHYIAVEAGRKRKMLCLYQRFNRI